MTSSELRSFGRALVVFVVGVALALTLYPFRFHLATASLHRIDWQLFHHRHGHVVLDRDFVVNVLMLVPLGVGWAMVRNERHLGLVVLEALLLGTGLAVAIETLQIFESTRFPQLADVWRNGAGCMLGALATCLVLRRQATVSAAPPAPKTVGAAS